MSLPSGDSDSELWSGSGTGSSSACCSDGSEVESPQAQDESVTCGGHIKHISLAGTFLLDAERREFAPHDDDLEVAYRSYVDVMNSKGLDPLSEAQNEIPEFENDPPPS